MTPQCWLAVTLVKSFLFLYAKDVAHTTYPEALAFVTQGKEYLEVGRDQPRALRGDSQSGEEGTEDTGVGVQDCSAPGGMSLASLGDIISGAF